MSAIIAMARSLRLATIAEGVEQNVQRDFLIERGCREMQGFLFSRPLPYAALVTFIGGHGPA